MSSLFQSVKPVSVTAASAEQQTAASGKTQQAQSQQKEIKLPQALEKVLAFKDVRAQQVGVKPEDVEKIETGLYSFSKSDRGWVHI